MKVLVVEDDFIQLNGIVSILHSVFPEFEISTATDYKTATELIIENFFSLFLLDIELSGNDAENGVNLGMYIRSQQMYQLTPILFITALTDRVLSAMHNTNCYDYIVKPYEDSTLINSVSKLIQSPIMREQPLRLKGSDGVYFQIYPNNILWIKSEGRNMHIYTDCRHYRCNNVRMDKLLSSLPGFICRCHKSYAINTNQIDNVDKLNLLLTISDSEHTQIPVGKKYAKILNRELDI
jgi:two-component system LytT family response regulator